MVKQDILRVYSMAHGSRLRKWLTCYRTPGLHAVVLYRFGSWLLRQALPMKVFLKPVYVFLNHRMMIKWGIQIDNESQIGEGFLIFHYGGIFVGEDTVIGKNVSISHNVTIGRSGEGKRRGAPVIGDNVYIAPGANVSGKVRIGDNVRIGANAVIFRDIPENSLVQVPGMRIVAFPSFYSQKNSTPGTRT
jgi:serine O-acetyltransferase